MIKQIIINKQPGISTLETIWEFAEAVFFFFFNSRYFDSHYSKSAFRRTQNFGAKLGLSELQTAFLLYTFL